MKTFGWANQWKCISAKFSHFTVLFQLPFIFTLLYIGMYWYLPYLEIQFTQPTNQSICWTIFADETVKWNHCHNETLPFSTTQQCALILREYLWGFRDEETKQSVTFRCAPSTESESHTILTVLSQGLLILICLIYLPPHDHHQLDTVAFINPENNMSVRMHNYCFFKFD